MKLDVNPNMARSKEKVPFAAIPHALALDAAVSDGAYRLYGLLLRYAWQDGSTFVGQDRLSADMSASVDTVQRRLKELEQAGVITIKRRGRGLTNLVGITPISEVYPANSEAAPTRPIAKSEAAPERPQTPHDSGFSKKEEAVGKKQLEQKKQVLATSSSSSSSSSSDQVTLSDANVTPLRTPGSAHGESSELTERVSSEVTRRLLGIVPELSDDDLWTGYVTALGREVEDDQGILISDTLTQEAQKRFNSASER